jgi:flagellar hook-length control protein FliK
VAPTDAARTQSAESGAAIEIALPAKGTANQDAMTGQDQPNGQGRPSQEFMRFAAALAQVSPAAGEETGRAPAAVVAASAAPAPAAAAVTTPIAAAAPAPTTSADTPGPENVGRLVQAMRVIARPGAWEANVRLNPEHLGEVSIAVRVERNTVSAVVNAEAVGVRQWLESQEQAVRNGMAEHGLQLDRFIVQRDGQRRDAEPQQQESRRQAPRRQAAPTERFEIVV